ncbi:MAG: YqgE/AlgH family protein [Steroidobacteraceae bacterium]|jgi:putative transcriptional regulator|nr:YqgE/AlgH family protein [Steroidobacteraceae bacterium]
MAAAYLTNQLLIAMPSLADPNFAQTVTLICEHTDKGALGIVLNRPLEMTLGEVFDQLSFECGDAELRAQPVLRGGPVQPDRGFVLHHPDALPGGPADGRWDSTLAVSPRLHVTTSRDVLAAMAAGRGPAPAAIALGYAGWEAGQLEEEIRSNAWLNVPVDESILFGTPFEARWQAAAHLIGIDLGRLSLQAGHA